MDQENSIVLAGFINGFTIYRYCESFNKIGQEAFALALGPHNNTHIEIFLNQFFGIWGPQKWIFPLKTQI